MAVREIEAVDINYIPDWKKWPTTADIDFTEILRRRYSSTYQFGDLTLKINYRHYPPHIAYTRIGEHLRLPNFDQWTIDNTKPPIQAVLNQMVEDLNELGKECDLIAWHHGYQCFPYVTKHLPDLFKLRILLFSDDCPGSSEVKTFPVAKHFNALLHNMYVRDYNTGVRTADVYKELGVPYCHLSSWGQSDNLTTYLAEHKFSIEEKAEQIRQGSSEYNGLLFIGCDGQMNRARYNFLCDLNRQADKVAAQIEMPVMLHGKGMRNGILEPRQPPAITGYTIAPYYMNALFGVNYAISSIFNARFFNLGAAGVVQLIYDKNKELSDFGLEDYIHYVPFNGTIPGMIQAIKGIKHDKEKLGAIIIAAHQKMGELLSKYSCGAAYQETIKDHLHLFNQ